LKIGITIGDINGVGPEVILKTLSSPKLLEYFTPVVYGSSKILSYYKNTIKDLNVQFNNINDPNKAQANKINVINCWDDNVTINMGKVNEDGGKYAKIALDAAVSDIKKKAIDGIVTAPINKAAMKMAGFKYPGHTEYFEAEFGKAGLMLMLSDTLRIGLVTNHIPISEVATSVTKEQIMSKLKVFNEALKVDFGIDRPQIAVLGLNPHAGDQGAIGDHEEKIIKPAIIESKKHGIFAAGPYPADGFFGSSNYKKFDGILAMYHDQGLVALKSLSFGEGVNYTAGLSMIRTSPDHGTAYDIVGQDLAESSSFRTALYQCMDLIKNRFDYKDARANQLTKKIRPSDNEEEDEILEDV
jgi:4-phospho-D-threonate 3-dehydrogenase / 4-phospho-D-erythronate 3-dehydrogenase